MRKVPLMDLKAQYAALKPDIDAAIKRVLDAQAFILGADVETFEKNMADYCGTKYAVGVNSGTDALVLALDAMGIQQGDEVITSPFTFIATAEAIVRLGAKPVFVDVDEKTYTINPTLIEKKLTKNTKVILPVHLYGLPADMKTILEISKKHNLKVLEDSAQAIGSEVEGKRTGSIGDAGAFSFYPGKNLGGFGDGGMLTTNNENIYSRVKLLRNHGTLKKYHHKSIGYNSRLDNLQAAILNVKLARLDKWIESRIKNAHFFTDELKKYPLSTPHVPEGYKHSFHLYVVRSERTGDIMAYLNKNGVESRVYYPVPLHLQECFSSLGYKTGDLPVAEKLSEETFTLPVYPELAEEDKGYIIEVIKRFFE